MTIALPNSTKIGLMGRLGRKSRTAAAAPQTSRKPLEGREIAKLFAGDAVLSTQIAKPAKLNDTEKRDRANLSNLRGALYAKD